MTEAELEAQFVARSQDLKYIYRPGFWQLNLTGTGAAQQVA
ncbi:hypothetical protein SAMN04488058_13415 [Deinococcus reticulitermitis]|uniref:Uncharacterized protein n=1 Tax=Deinococcus reticulitermitis TaxID=856736 RepID=A0A1H7CR61_9DEIO|nr:hypothetical protein SAMN04488058_13415 [Deinococcus reticulitermitis]